MADVIIDPLKFHEVASLFPPMDEAEFSKLKADIAAHGQREPIWVAKEPISDSPRTEFLLRIIDGRHRYRACRELGIDPKVQIWDGKGSLVEFVVSVNLHRRHLDSGQRAAVAVDMMPLLEGEAKERQRAAGGNRKAVEAAVTEAGPPANSAARTLVHQDFGPYSQQPDGTWRSPEGREVSARGMERWQAQGRVGAPEAAAAQAVSQKVDGAPPDRNAGKAAAQAAKLTGTNRQYVADAKKLKAEDPEAFEGVKAGKVKLSEAKRRSRRKRSPAYDSLDADTRRILGEHELIYSDREMLHLSFVETPTERHQVARLLVDGKARKVKEAQKALVPAEVKSATALERIKKLLPWLTAEDREILRGLVGGPGGSESGPSESRPGREPSP
jgi:hypothetical protein